MKITILCSSPEHPVNAWLCRWISENEDQHQIDLIRRKVDLTNGDLLFLISCSEIIGMADRASYRKALVVHASALPDGRGWSPHIWHILEGKERLTVTLLEAEDRVDSGDIWQQVEIVIPKTALFDEINNILFSAELDLMSFAVLNFNVVNPCPQSISVESAHYPKRRPEDSEVDSSLSLAEQFDKIRVSDPERFPAFFRLRGCKYRIVLEKMEDG